MDIFESLENLAVSEECFEDIIGLVEELLNESNRARKYGQKLAGMKDFKMASIVGTKALKDSTQMNPSRDSANLIARRVSSDVGSVPAEGDHDERYDTLHTPETQKAFKEKKALQGAIKSLEQADSYTARKSLPELKKSARAISRRDGSGENEDVLAKNKFGRIKGNYKNVMNSFNNHYGYNKLEDEIRDSKKEK